MNEVELLSRPALRHGTRQPDVTYPAGAAARPAHPAAPFGDEFPELSTERLRLREIRMEDAESLFAIHGDPVVMRWFGNDSLSDLRAAQRLIEFFARCRQAASGTRWGIERKEDGRLLGTCGFYAWDRNYRRSHIGYELGTFAWGKGYMQEALSAVMSWGFTHMQLHRIEAHIHPDNTASIKLAKSFGFVEEGLLRELEFWAGRYHDMLLFSLLQGDHANALKGLPRNPRRNRLQEAAFRFAKLLGRRH